MITEDLGEGFFPLQVLLYILRFDGRTFDQDHMKRTGGQEKAQRLPSKNGDWRPRSSQHCKR